MSKQGMTLYDYLRIGHVKRWHNVNTIRQQTVAEHSFMVALIAVELFTDMNMHTKESDILPVLIGAMFHDMPEVVTGDIPTPAKRYLREFTNQPDLFDKIDDQLMPELPYIGGPLDFAYEPFIKVADAIEGVHWISENGAGRHAEIVATANWRRLEDLVAKYDAEAPNVGWYEATNRILMNMNMRYVHKQSRMTPP